MEAAKAIYEEYKSLDAYAIEALRTNGKALHQDLLRNVYRVHDEL